jgi:hypothetical protein
MKNKLMDRTGNHTTKEEAIIDDTEVSPHYEDIYDYEENSMNIPKKRTFFIEYPKGIRDKIIRANSRHHIRRHTLKEEAKDAEKIAQLENEQKFLRDEIKELRLSLKDQSLMKQQINDLHSDLIIRKNQFQSTNNVTYDRGEVSHVVSFFHM